MDTFDHFSIAVTPNWQDYELIDSGNGLKFERFGPYSFVRPEVQAMWKPVLLKKIWSAADAVFEPTSEESGGHWLFRKTLPERWQMNYTLQLLPSGGTTKYESGVSSIGISPKLRFWSMTTPGRHLGVFPETAYHWNYMAGAVQNADRPMKILNLFGYTGLATLAAALAGAQVTHVDASRKSVNWARENQTLSGLDDKPIRWIVEDALKYVQREGRRGVKYDGIVIDPPKFGRGPKGEVWEVYKSLPDLLAACRKVLSDKPLFVIVTIYAVRASAIHIGQALADVMNDYRGGIEKGELVTREKSAGRLLSQAVFARWQPEST